MNNFFEKAYDILRDFGLMLCLLSPLILLWDFKTDSIFEFIFYLIVVAAYIVYVYDFIKNASI